MGAISPEEGTRGKEKGPSGMKDIRRVREFRERQGKGRKLKERKGKGL